MVDTWADGHGRWYAIAPDARQAATAIRAELLTRGDIGKYTPVTVEKMSDDTFREVWSE